MHAYGSLDAAKVCERMHGPARRKLLCSPEGTGMLGSLDAAKFVGDGERMHGPARRKLLCGPEGIGMLMVRLMRRSL